jgi:predicted 2-oxoglutarate/Fe(II)-dependent dioxygenase YbiX
MTDYAAKLQSVLEGIGESSRFVAVGRVPPVLPGLDVKGVGLVGTPVTAADARRLIEQASQAPFGRGEETIVDTSVRRVWQIEPSKFKLRNLDWNAFLDGIVGAVKQELGIGQKVEHQLYKLLVYQKGSFFAPHRDSEKAPGMFATLVVCLPSAHEGAKLVVRHDGQTVDVDFSGADAEFKVQYVAFYADCEHEILPVTKGYRVCLVYNLALAGRKRQPRPPQNRPRVEAVAGLLRGLFAGGARNKIAVPLEHQYTQAGLDPRELKGSDRARLDILVRAAEKLDYQVFLAFLTHSQSGEADYSSWGYRHDNRRRFYDSYDDDEEDEDEDDAAVVGEVFEEQLSLDGWQDVNDRKKPFGKMRLEENEVLDVEQARTYEQHVHEATGNEGATLERQYHQAAVVLWPRDRYFRILAAEGSRSSVPALEEMLRSRKSSPDDCQQFAEQIIQHWKRPRHSYHAQASQSALMLKLLKRIGSVELGQRFVKGVLPEDFNGTEGPPSLQTLQPGRPRPAPRS